MRGAKQRQHRHKVWRRHGASGWKTTMGFPTACSMWRNLHRKYLHELGYSALRQSSSRLYQSDTGAAHKSFCHRFAQMFRYNSRRQTTFREDVFPGPAASASGCNVVFIRSGQRTLMKDRRVSFPDTRMRKLLLCRAMCCPPRIDASRIAHHGSFYNAPVQCVRPSFSVALGY